MLQYRPVLVDENTLLSALYDDSWTPNTVTGKTTINCHSSNRTSGDCCDSAVSFASSMYMLTSGEGGEAAASVARVPRCTPHPPPLSPAAKPPLTTGSTPSTRPLPSRPSAHGCGGWARRRAVFSRPLRRSATVSAHPFSASRATSRGGRTLGVRVSDLPIHLSS